MTQEAVPNTTGSLPEPPEAAGLPPYARLLLVLARLRPDADQVALARSLAGRDDLDWGAFLDAAARHKLLPLVGRHVHTYRLGRPAGDAKGFPYPWLFASAHLGNRQRNQALSDEFGLVLKELADAGVPYAVRKGFSLAEGVYHDASVRRISDLDLLVDRSDAPLAHEVLVRLGYLQGNLAADGDRIEPFKRETQLFWRLNLSNQLPYLKAGNRPDVSEYNVDLCHDIFQRKSGSSASAAELLRRRVPVVLCGTGTWVAEPVDALLDLCSHLHKEATSLRFIEDSVDLQISKFLDVSLFAADFGDTEWDDFTDRTKQYDAAGIAYYALHHTELLYPGAIPARVLDTLRPEDTGYLDQYGTLDGLTARWSLPFLDRLFDTGRGRDSAQSNVPHA
ncbi:nucleotidyltransferase domain-containing protein [Streptomyces sp. B21-083]|uniref:nucleotidyltransferase domain-containing protein n=1 Tax=Streptomyces sp. B21-083 TaxID=3039410 RepID=UPI002FF28661